MNIVCAFTVIHRHVRSGETFKSPMALPLSSEVPANAVRVLFPVCRVPRFPRVCVFVGDFPV